MNRFALSLTCAALLAAASAPPAAAQALLQQCDKAMAEADSLGQQVAACYDSLSEARAAFKAKARMEAEANSGANARAQSEAARRAKAIADAAADLKERAAAEAAARAKAKAQSEADSAWRARAQAEARAALKAKAAAEARGAARADGTSRIPDNTTEMWVEFSTGFIPGAIAAAAGAEPMAESLVAYYAYDAYASGDPKLCAPLHYLNQVKKCEDSVRQLAFMRAQQGAAPEFAAACREAEARNSMSRGQRRSPAAEKQALECCGLFAENKHLSDPCPKLFPGCVPDLVTCRNFIAALGGDAGGCLKAADCRTTPADCRQERADCLDGAAFAKAFRAKDAAACGASDRCRVLMGAGRQVVAEREAELLKSAPGRWFVKREWQNVVRKKVIGIGAVPKEGVSKSWPVERDRKAAPPPAVAPKPPVAQTPPPSRTPPPARTAPVAQSPVARATTEIVEMAPVAPKFVSTIKGFTCEEPLRSAANRKTAAAILNTAHTCLSDIELALQRIDPATARGIDDREEKLARLKMRLEKYFTGAVSQAPKQGVR